MKKIKVGIFGLNRGAGLFSVIKECGGEIVAICDRNEERLQNCLKHCRQRYNTKVEGYGDFVPFINHPGMEAVIILNHFNEHAPYAAQALEKGIHVITEGISNVTMAEGVALVRGAEKGGAFFMLAENYPFLSYNTELKKIYKSGKLGRAIYCEGEYNHAKFFGSREEYRMLHPYPGHWRNYLPRTYYISHSLGPLMSITGARPKRVVALPVYAPYDDVDFYSTFTGDRAAIMSILNDDSSVFRVTGCASFGATGSSFRICGTKGQAENIRGSGGYVSVRYNPWDVPEGEEEKQYYKPETENSDFDLLMFSEFFDCIRKKRRPEMDEYFATAMASCAILGLRSLLERGTPYDIPDLRCEADRLKYENDTLNPFIGPNGEPPTIPCCSRPEYKPGEAQYRTYLKMVDELKD